MAGKKTYVIETLNTHFNGVREGLQFKDGKAETTDKKLAELLTNPGDHRNYFCAQLNKPLPKNGDTPDEGEGEGGAEEGGDDAD